MSLITDGCKYYQRLAAATSGKRFAKLLCAWRECRPPIRGLAEQRRNVGALPGARLATASAISWCTRSNQIGNQSLGRRFTESLHGLRWGASFSTARGRNHMRYGARPRMAEPLSAQCCTAGPQDADAAAECAEVRPLVPG